MDPPSHITHPTLHTPLLTIYFHHPIRNSQDHVLLLCSSVVLPLFTPDPYLGEGLSLANRIQHANSSISNELFTFSSLCNSLCCWLESPLYAFAVNQICCVRRRGGYPRGNHHYCFIRANFVRGDPADLLLMLRSVIFEPAIGIDVNFVVDAIIPRKV